MGKLRFTLTYILFWFIIIFSCLLAENFDFFVADHMGGMRTESVLFLSTFVIFLLIVYYVKERKKNKITFDKILLPIIIIFGLISIATVWWQGERIFIDSNSGADVSVAFTPHEKISFTLQIIIWCAVLYGVLFVANRYSISRKWLKWLLVVYTFGIFAFTFIDIIIEFKDIIAIFNNTYSGSGLAFIVYNPNVWANCILIAIFCCIILSIKKFSVFYYILMVHFTAILIFTSSTTSVFIAFAVIIGYTLYEILSKLKTRTRWASRMLFIYLMILLMLFGFFAMMVSLNVPLFVNLWSFLNHHILQKDYSTLTSRTGIWASVFALLCKNSVDLIFGLGYKSGNAIFMQYYATQAEGFYASSAHNGIVEIVLRHGLLGLLLYIGLLSTFVVGIVKLNKNKQYRVAFLYGICFLGILAHSVTESTMLFTPNTEGTFLTLAFFLPVVNASKEKHFTELNEDLQSQPIALDKPNKLDVLQFVFKLLLGLLEAFAMTFILNSMHTMGPLVIVYIVLTSITLVALAVVSVILIKNKCLTFGKDTWLPLVITLGSIVLIYLLLTDHDTSSTLTTTLFFISFYILVFSILYKKENNRLYAFFDEGLTKTLQTISCEGPNE